MVCCQTTIDSLSSTINVRLSHRCIPGRSWGYHNPESAMAAAVATSSTVGLTGDSYLRLNGRSARLISRMPGSADTAGIPAVVTVALLVAATLAAG